MKDVTLYVDRLNLIWTIGSNNTELGCCPGIIDFIPSTGCHCLYSELTFVLSFLTLCFLCQPFQEWIGDSLTPKIL